MTEPAKNPISFPDLFGRSIALYAQNFLVLVNLSFACTAPTIFKSLLDGAGDQGLSWIAVVLMPIVFIINTFFLMCLTYMTAMLATDQQVTVREAVDHVRGKFFRGVGGYLLLSAAVILGTVLLVLPGLYCFVVFYFFVFAILLEDAGIVASFKRSDELVRSRFWTVLLAHGLVFLMTMILLLPVIFGLSMMGLAGAFTTVFVGVVTAVVMPVLVAFYYFVYAALKAEHDGVMNISVHT